MIIFWPTPKTPIPLVIKCDLMITRYLNEYLRQRDKGCQSEFQYFKLQIF
jgi:hypothetical protein